MHLSISILVDRKDYVEEIKRDAEFACFKGFSLIQTKHEGIFSHVTRLDQSSLQCDVIVAALKDRPLQYMVCINGSALLDQAPSGIQCGDYFDQTSRPDKPEWKTMAWVRTLKPREYSTHLVTAEKDSWSLRVTGHSDIERILRFARSLLAGELTPHAVV